MKQTLVAWRKGRDLTQAELADLIGVTRKTVNAWENGRGEPSVTELYKLEKVLKLNPSDRILFERRLT